VPAAPKPAARAEANSAKPPTPDHRRPPLTETASYRVKYSILGEVAEATITFTPGPGPGAAGADSSRSMVRAMGTGKGAVLGFGKTEKRIESEFDARTLKTTRWTITRSSGDETVIDSAEQQEPGKVSTVRKRAGKPDEAVSLTRSTAVLDPLGFLLRLRLGPLQAPATFEILDGRALWIANISAVRPTDEIPPTLRIDGRVDPIFWDGRPADDRTSHNFSLFLSNDGYRTPVRLTVPFGLGEARAEIVQLSRYATARRAWRGIMPIVPRFLSLKKRPGMGSSMGPGGAR